MRSFASGFIFTTALPPALAAGATASIRHPKASSVERVAQHRNGKGSEPYLSVFFTATSGAKLHALLFAAPSHVAVFDLADPAARLCAGTYEHELRAIAADVGLPYDGRDPLEALHDRATTVLALVRQRRAECPPGPEHGRAKLRAIGRHLDCAVHTIACAMERAKA